MPTPITNWNWQASFVSAETTKAGAYASSESTLLLAGPSRLSMLGASAETSASLIPIGLVQGFAQSQNKQTNRLYEIGSKRAYFIPGRLFANFTLSRTVFFGPSLLRMLYALAPINGLDGGKLGDFGTALDSGETTTIPPTGVPEYSALFPDDKLKNAPGFGGAPGEVNRDFYMNLNSELFNAPFGLCVVLKDARDRPYGASYLEDCYVEAHNLQIDASNTVMAENVSGQFDQATAVQLSTTAA